jgi:hypothetical protein
MSRQLVRQHPGRTSLSPSNRNLREAVAPGEEPWWTEYYTDALRIRDRKLFA